MDQLLALRVFVRVVDANSFSKASHQLNLPRSSVSKLVAQLEAHLGAKLFHRTTRKLAITQEGADYYERTRLLIGEIDGADAQIRERRLKPSGALRIEATSAFANLMLIPALPAFRQAYPDITLSVGISDRKVDLIEEGVDCAIRGGVLADASFVARRLLTYEHITFASRAYLARAGVPRDPRELLEHHDLVGYFSAATGKSIPLTFERGGDNVEIDRFSIAANESTGHVGMILAGLGIGQSFRRLIQQHLDSGELVTILDDWKRPPVPFHIIYPANRTPSGKLRAFIDWAVATFA